MQKLSLERLLFWIIVLVYIVVATLFAANTPDWQAPDEPAHYNYVAQIAASGCCPVIEMGDWQQDYQSDLTRRRFAPDRLDDLPTIQYQDHQPPLYYSIASVSYQLFDGDLFAVRMTSVLMGIVVIISTYAIGREVFPARPQLGLAAMAFVAFLPQHIAVMSSVTNDALSQMVISLIILSLVRYLKHTGVTAWGLGFWIGVGFVTKATTYLYAGVALLVILMAILIYRTHKQNPLFQWLRSVYAFLAVSLVLGAMWWSRNIAVYGFPDFLGLGAHNDVVVGQPRTAEWIAQQGFMGYFNHAAQTTFNSFWGQFGWMALPLPPNLYLIIYGLVGLALTGLVINLVMLRLQRSSRTLIIPFVDVNGEIYRRNSGNLQRSIWAMMFVSLILSVLAYIYYNFEFVQPQGRYLYPGLIPFALIFVLGLDGWRQVLIGRIRASRWLLPIALIGFAALDVWLLFRFIVPWLSYDGLGI